MPIQRFKVIVISISIAYILLYYGLLLFLPKESIDIASDLLSPIGIMFSLFVLVYSIKRHKDSYQKRYWWMCFFGGFTFLLGDLPWAYYEIIIKTEVVFPSIADVFYMLSPLFYFIAMLMYFRYSSYYLTLRMVFDILIIIVISAALEWKLIFLPIYFDSTLSTSVKIISLLYPVTDLGLLFGSVLIAFSQKNNFKIKAFILTPLIFIFADIVYLFESMYGTYYAGQLIDPLWALGILIISIVSLESVQTNERSTSSTPLPEWNRMNQILRIIITYSLAGIIIIIMCIFYLKFDPLSIGAIGTIFLFFSRQIFTLLENQRLMKLLLESKVELENTIEKLNDVNQFIKLEARTDFLTRLFNRRCMEELLLAVELQGATTNTPYAVMMIDIDHFKAVNDQFGHDAGDLVLQQLSLLLSKGIGSEDSAGRWGGEEFLIIIRNTNVETIRIIAEDLRKLVENSEFNIGDVCIRITISIGAACWKDDHDFKGPMLISKADEALYKAKQNGRNYVVISY